MKKRTDRIVAIALLAIAAGLALYALWPEPLRRDLYIKNSGFWTKETVIRFEEEKGHWRYAGPWVLKKGQGRYADFRWSDGSVERVRSFNNTFYVYVGWAPFGIGHWTYLQQYIENEKFEKVTLGTDSDGDYVLDLSDVPIVGPIVFILFLMGAAAVAVGVWYIKYRHTIYTPDLRR